MTYEQAKELGVSCGLEHPHEWINNIIIHATSLFYWPEMNRELKELIDEAESIGVKFAICGHAHINEKDSYCYMCENFQEQLPKQSQRNKGRIDGNKKNC